MGKQPRELSEKTLRLRAASRYDDGFFSTFVLRKISRQLTGILVETPIKPNTVTVISLLIGLGAAYISGAGNYLIGGLLLLLSLILDCVDGEIARYKKEFSTLGAWLDALSDRVKEYAYIAGLIYSLGEERAWWIGIALVILQTIRHLSDYNFVRVQRSFEESIREESKRRNFIYWSKKILNLPIGERWLLLAVLPIVTPITTALRILLYSGLLSFVYVLFARLRRMRSWSKSHEAQDFIVAQRDTFLPLRLEGSKFAWAYPSILRALEFLAFVTLPLDISPLVRYLFIFSISIWHYTNLYDALQDRSPKFGGAGLRMAGRISLVFLAHLLGLDFEITVLLTIYLAVLIIVRGGHNVARGVS